MKIILVSSTNPIDVNVNRAETDESILQVLQTRLIEGLVHFEYKKANGDVREAYGTLNSKYIKQDPTGYANSRVERFYQSKFSKDYTILPIDKIFSTADKKEVFIVNLEEEEVKLFDDGLMDLNLPHFISVVKKVHQPEHLLKYWDLEAQGWRMFTKDSIIAVY